MKKGDIMLSGGLANQRCPAHTNWETKKGVKGGVFLRCTTHDVANAKWLADQGREGHISKEKGAILLCEEDAEQGCLLSVLDPDIQKEVGNWSHDATEKIAHTLSLEFAQWLVQQARDDN